MRIIYGGGKKEPRERITDIIKNRKGGKTEQDERDHLSAGQ